MCVCVLQRPLSATSSSVWLPYTSIDQLLRTLNETQTNSSVSHHQNVPLSPYRTGRVRSGELQGFKRGLTPALITPHLFVFRCTIKFETNWTTITNWWRRRPNEDWSLDKKKKIKKIDQSDAQLERSRFVLRRVVNKFWAWTCLDFITDSSCFSFWTVKLWLKSMFSLHFIESVVDSQRFLATLTLMVPLGTDAWSSTFFLKTRL